MSRGAPIVAIVAVVLVVLAPAADARPTPLALRVLQMTDVAHGYALSGQNPEAYRLLHTDDGGRRWTDVTPGNGTIHPSGPITILGRMRLFSTKVRQGVFAVERSDDGGSTWHRSLLFRNAHGQGIGQPFAVDAQHLYVAIDEGAAAGSQGEALYTSSDAGHSWRFVSGTSVYGSARGALPFGCDKSGFGFSTPTRGWAGGYCAGGQPFFYRTDDGGRSWSRRSLAVAAQCACETSSPSFFTPRVGVLYVSGFAMDGSGKPFVRVFWTSDGGAHWRGSSPRTGRASAVSFADARTAWVAAQPPGSLRGPFNRLFRTSDAGRHWQTIRVGFDAGNYAFDAVSATVAYALRTADASNTIVVTRDGGRTWRTIHAVLTKD